MTSVRQFLTLKCCYQSFVCAFLHNHFPLNHVCWTFGDSAFSFIIPIFVSLTTTNDISKVDKDHSHVEIPTSFTLHCEDSLQINMIPLSKSLSKSDSNVSNKILHKCKNGLRECLFQPDFSRIFLNGKKKTKITTLSHAQKCLKIMDSRLLFVKMLRNFGLQFFTKSTKFSIKCQNGNDDKSVICKYKVF